MEDERTDAARADTTQARRVLAETQLFGPGALQAARLTRLRGLTNRVWRVDLPDGRFCLRLPRPDPAIDRIAEASNARAAAAAGVAPPVLHADADGVMVTPFVAGTPLSPALFREPGMVERAAAALRQLHDGSAPFVGEFRAFAVADRYLATLAARGAPLSGDAGLRSTLAAVRAALEASPAAACPCHCDPTGANLIDDGTRIWMIDWEYAAMNDRFWDLGYLAAEGAFDAGMERRLLRSCIGAAAGPAAEARLAACRVLTDIVSALWALLQVQDAARQADFAADAGLRLARSARRADTPAFRRQLDILRLG